MNKAQSSAKTFPTGRLNPGAQRRPKLNGVRHSLRGLQSRGGVENGTALPWRLPGVSLVPAFRSCAYQLTVNAPAKKQLRGGNRKRDPALEEMRGVADPCMRIPNKSPALAGLFLMIAAIIVRGGGPRLPP